MRAGCGHSPHGPFDAVEKPGITRGLALIRSQADIDDCIVVEVGTEQGSANRLFFDIAWSQIAIDLNSLGFHSRRAPIMAAPAFTLVDRSESAPHFPGGI